jgi:hypothetical protein
MTSRTTKNSGTTRISSDVEKSLDGKGHTKSTETKTYEILNIYGEQVQKLIEKDDKPISDEEAAKQEEKIHKIISRRQSESEKDRQKRTERGGKDRQEERQFESEIVDAYNFSLLGTERVDGGAAWLIRRAATSRLRSPYEICELFTQISWPNMDR